MEPTSPETPIKAFCDLKSELARRLSNHYGISSVQAVKQAPLEFLQGDWHRKVWIGRPEISVSGLVELMDNNPIVCADEISVPSPCATLALIALGPLIRAGMIMEPPALQFSSDGDEDEIESFLANQGWDQGAMIRFEGFDLGNACACNAIVSISNPEDWNDIDSLYEEAYGRSFFVERVEEGEWDAKLVTGKPVAAFRLRLTPGGESSLLTVQVMADSEGKCGSAQLVHAMNVMAGFEETVGIQ